MKLVRCQQRQGAAIVAVSLLNVHILTGDCILPVVKFVIGLLGLGL